MVRSLKWVLGIVLTSSILLVSAPYLVRWYINRRPDVHVDRVEILNLHTVRLHGVTVTRSDVHASLLEATVDKTAKTIEILGGKVTLLDAKKATDGESSGFRVTAREINVEASKEGADIRLEGVNVDALQASFTTAKVMHPKAEITVHGGWFKRDLSEVHGDNVVILVEGGEDLGLLVVNEAAFVRNNNGGFNGEYTAKEVINGDRRIADVRVVRNEKSVTAFFGTVGFTLPHVSPEPLTLRSIGFDVDDYTKVLEVPLHTSVGRIPINIDLKQRRVWASGPCQDWLEALPEELRGPPLDTLRFKGDLSVEVVRSPVTFKLKQNCKTANVPGFVKELKSGQFKYVAYDAKKQEVERVTGPKSEDWVALTDISPNMVLAVTTTEDPSFFDHHGFVPESIENSLRDNLKAGKFMRGGSTITMQLAKNLWLRRSKTLGRKIQEAFLTMALESNFTKNEILALYLNAVEFGPNTYGIKNAAGELLGTEPSKLTLSESIYLAERLPNPVKAGPLSDAKRPSIKRVLDIMVTRGKISPDVAVVEGNATYPDPTTADLVVNQ